MKKKKIENRERTRRALYRRADVEKLGGTDLPEGALLRRGQVMRCLGIGAELVGILVENGRLKRVL